MLTADWSAIPALTGIRVVATERELDDIQQATALTRGRSIGKAPAAPNSHRTVGLLLSLISPHQDMDRAADELDDLVAAALDYLDTRFLHEDATVVGYGDRLAFDIPISVLASKE
jgi:hypothetical protein